jgi:hypothetical protein
MFFVITLRKLVLKLEKEVSLELRVSHEKIPVLFLHTVFSELRDCGGTHEPWLCRLPPCNEVASLLVYSEFHVSFNFN